MRIVLYRAMTPDTPPTQAFAGALSTRPGEAPNWFTAGPTAEAVQAKLEALAEKERKSLEDRPPPRKKATTADLEPVQASVGVVEDPGDVV